MKKHLIIPLLTLALPGITSSASAITFVGQYAGNDNPESVVETILGEPAGSLMRLKVDEPGSSDGLLTVTYDVGPPSSSGTWSFTGSSDATKQLAALVVKAGTAFNLYEFAGGMAHTPGLDIGGIWSTAGGVMTADTIQLDAKGAKDISHLSIYLKTVNGNGVPDGGASVLLLGLSLVGFSLFRRLRK